MSAPDTVRELVRDGIARELRSRMGEGSGTGVLHSSAGGWVDVLSVDRERLIVRVQKRGEPDADVETRALEDWSSLLRF